MNGEKINNFTVEEIKFFDDEIILMNNNINSFIDNYIKSKPKRNTNSKVIKKKKEKIINNNSEEIVNVNKRSENHADFKGENHPRSILKEKDVIEIRIDLSEGILSQREIGEKFGVNQTTISCIKHKRIWKHIK